MTPEPSSRSDLDAKLQRLQGEARTFARASAREKAELLGTVRARFLEASPKMVELGCKAKGLASSSPLAGEEWFSGPAISIRALRLFQASLEEVAAHGAPRLDARGIEPQSNGRTRVTLLPHDAYDRALFMGWSCEARLSSQRSPKEIFERQARFYREAAPEGRVVLVLGAGNVGSISVLDVLYHSFAEGAVCLLKMSPVNAYLGPGFEYAFAPLVERGFLALAYGGPDVGGYLTGHAAVDAIHVTGSVDTHDRIVWGPAGPEREARKQAGKPLIEKTITSELGNVSPVLVLPATYSDRELDAAARSIVGMVTHNASFNCNAAKMIVTARGWKQRDDLLSRLRALFSRTPTRLAYYPGALDRFNKLVADAEPGRVERHGDATGGKLPWTLISGLDAGADSALFRVEPFCSIVSEVPLDASEIGDFLDRATTFANDKLWGTLNAMLILPDSLGRDAAHRTAVDRALSLLRYGTVGVNLWPAASYGLGGPPWGGYPGATLLDVESGIGWGHNAFLLEDVEKVVLRGPLVSRIQPIWYPGHRQLSELGARFTAFEASPSVLSVLGAAWPALRA